MSRIIRNTVLIIVSVLIITAAGCSVVFTGSITGSIVDREQYDNGTSGPGIADAEVYLYTKLDDRDADYELWAADNTALPDNPVEGEPAYFLKTITDDQGSYTFNGFIWNDFFPDYGKSGDRKEIYMLFHHREYGLVKTPYPVYVVSDVTNRIPLFKLDKILNTAEIAGSVSNADNGEALANVNIRIWVPETWSYDSAGNITGITWPENPSYTAVTDTAGEWSQNISYSMVPSSTDNKGTTIIRITYAANGYIAENSADTEIIDGGWDVDGNGTVDDDENDGYYQSGAISTESYTDLGDISLADEYNSAVVSGSVVNSSTNSGEQNVSVRIYVAEDWDYNSSDPEDIEAAANVDWPENPQYTLSTDTDGNFSTSVRFERKPSESDNRGTVRIRIVYVKNNFLINSTTDADLTDGGWDRDGNGTVDADEDDSFYDPADVVTADLDNDTGTIIIKQTEFNETLRGEVWDDLHAVNVNGVEVWLYYAPSDDDADPATPKETDDPSVLQPAPDYITHTTSYSNPVTGELELGRFSFAGLEWEDTGYTGNQSKVSYYICLPSAAERSAGTLDGSSTLYKYYLTSGSSNYISIDQ